MKEKQQGAASPTEWFVLRVTYQRELLAKQMFDELQVPCFLPMEWVKKRTSWGKEVKVRQPAIHNYVFVRSTREQLDSLKRYRMPFLRYVMSASSGRKEVQTVPEEQMESFIAVAGSEVQKAEFLNLEELDLTCGDRVRVVAGPFEGVVGVYMRTANTRCRRVVVQVADKDKAAFKEVLDAAGIAYVKLGKPVEERHILAEKDGATYQFGIDYLRDVWYETSYLLDTKQSFNGCAKQRYENYKQQPVEFHFHPEFKGTFESYGITPERRTPSGVRAAIIREKGTNGEREMAYVLYLAGFDVKDVMMTDLISGRETLDDINMIVFCGGFSNSDVLGSAKGWAGAFLYNPKAKAALDRFYAREDTLSLGVCNGCQLMVELNLINPEHKKRSRMLHNNSHKFESAFLGVTVTTNRSVMFGSLSGDQLGIWVAHGEGKFDLPLPEDRYNVVLKYNYDSYPGNPNGSSYNVAGIASPDGRHLAMMPHLERAFFPWQNAYYPADRLADDVTPWVEAFVNARKWVEAHRK